MKIYLIETFCTRRSKKYGVNFNIIKIQKQLSCVGKEIISASHP